MLSGYGPISGLAIATPPASGAGWLTWTGIPPTAALEPADTGTVVDEPCE